MTTKEQEREALKKIEKIISDLGNDSYIAAALEGCLEIAADNIENDFACSMKQRAEAAEQKTDELKDKVAELANELAETRRDKNHAENDLAKALASLQEHEQNYTAEIDRLNNLVSDYMNDCSEAEHYNEELKKELTEAEQTIIELKAKLYDYMTK